MAEEDTMAQDMMGMMMVIMMVAVLSQMIPGQVQAAGRNVTVTLRNPPVGDYWRLMMVDYDRTENRLVEDLTMDEAAVFTDLPSYWRLPLKVDLMVFKAGLEVYRIQSYIPYLWDFDKMDWGTEPEPTYKELLLYAFGTYYFDFSTETFTVS